jgi:hypothetical protein
MSQSPTSESSLMETHTILIKPDVAINSSIKPDKNNKIERSYYTYMLGLLVVTIVICLLYHSYSCYCVNQDLYENEDEGFIDKTIKSGTDSDLSFDVDDEVTRLIQKQEKYLDHIQKNSRPL